MIVALSANLGLTFLNVPKLRTASSSVFAPILIFPKSIAGAAADVQLGGGDDALGYDGSAAVAGGVGIVTGIGTGIGTGSGIRIAKNRSVI